MSIHGVTLAALTAAALSCAPPQGRSPADGLAPVPSAAFAKTVSFAILEDYDKGRNLREVERDFELMKQLGVRTWRGRVRWDDYEPERGRFDFEWLHRFADLAAQHGIELRPYIGYTPAWAASGGQDQQAWNDPPARLGEWAGFVQHLVGAMSRHANIRSWEIYNGENVRLWWEGSADQYAAVLAAGTRAVRAADPDAEVLIGGLVWPDADWVARACAAARPDVIPIHAYPETRSPDSVDVERYLGEGYRNGFLAAVREHCGGLPIWINETGYATTAGRSERDQADWWVRAFATFLADPAVEHLGISRIKDLPGDSAVSGDEPNKHLGLTRQDRAPKLAFHTVDLLTDLLDVGRLTVADAELSVSVTAGSTGSLHHHLFVRPDGRQVLIAWDKRGGPALDVSLARRGSRATEYTLDGRPVPYPRFDGRTLRRLRLVAGHPRILEILPPEHADPAAR
jgi:polysaccharide biosynthesis protein PslG